jgi:hypothetical protein
VWSSLERNRESTSCSAAGNRFVLERDSLVH